MTLDEKIIAARALMADILAEHGAKHVAVAWTGGKDSTVALDLWRSVLEEAGQGEPARAISIDTGLKFAEVVAFRDQWAEKWGLNLTIARPDKDLAAYPIAEDTVTCCAELKIAPLRTAIRKTGTRVLITGLRRDEHPSRQDRDYREGRTDPDHLQLNPILDFTEMDVWAYITSRQLPFCGLYGQGYRSLGCVPCTEKSGPSERSGRDQSKELHLDTLRSLGYF